MTAIQVSAKLAGQSEADAVKVQYDFGDNLKEMVAKFGEEVVCAHAKGSCIISLQGIMRGLMRDKTDKDGKVTEAAKNAKQIAEAVASWSPTLRKPGASKAEKAENLLGSLTPEERKALLKKFG